MTQQAQSQNSLQKAGEAEAFLQMYNPSYQLEICDDPGKCFFGDFPTLADIKRDYGKNVSMAWLVPQMFNLSEFCGVKEKMSKEQLKDTAYVIATEYYYLKVSELMLFFHRFKAGRYGRFYGNVDPLVITSALREFCEERKTAIWKKESEDAIKAREESMKNGITWDEYCRQTGQLHRIGKTPVIGSEP